MAGSSNKVTLSFLFVLGCFSAQYANAAGAVAPPKSLQDELTTFKTQSASVQNKMAEIERIASKCDSYGERVQNELVKPSSSGRKDLAALTIKLERMVGSLGAKISTGEAGACAGASAVTDAANIELISIQGALQTMKQTDTELELGRQKLNAPGQASKINLVLMCGNPGNPFVVKKLSAAKAEFEKLNATHKRMHGLVKEQNTDLSAYAKANLGTATKCGAVVQAKK